MKNVIRTAAAVLAIGVCTSAANARPSDSGLVREAHRVVDYAEDLTREVSRHFRHTSEYRHLLSDAIAIKKKSKHIDSLSHHVHGLSDVRHLKDDVEDLDELVHHVGDLIARIDRGCSRGHYHGDTRHVRELVAWMNRSLHNMEAIVRDLERRYSRPPACESDHGYGRGYRSVGERIASGVLREIGRRH
jgi:hypothetical protein